MRPARTALALVATAAVSASFVSAATAQTNARRGCRISVDVAPNEITAGDPVIVFGRLACSPEGGQLVRLFHHVFGSAGFTPVGVTRTDSRGFYQFDRADGVVMTNRSWYVRSLGARSAVASIRVAAQVTLSGPPNGSQLLTGPAHAVMFTGTVDPNDRGARVILQRQNAANGNGWVRIDSGRVRAGGNYSIAHVFKVPGDANIRALVRSDGRDIPSPSNVLEYEISQAQNPNLTIGSSADPITYGQSVVISGTAGPSGPLGAPGQALTLLARQDGQQFMPVATTVSGPGGSYSFPAQVPVHSTFFQVQGPKAKSAVLYEGVQDMLTAQASATSVPAGQSITFSGSVAPDHTGHVIYLERQDANSSDFHVVEVRSVGNGSMYSIVHRFYAQGTGTYRVYIPGGRENEGAASQTFAVTVTPAPASTLTPEPPGNSSQPETGQQ